MATDNAVSDTAACRGGMGGLAASSRPGPDRTPSPAGGGQHVRSRVIARSQSPADARTDYHIWQPNTSFSTIPPAEVLCMGEDGSGLSGRRPRRSVLAEVRPTARRADPQPLVLPR
jgi:hypothetical protein